MVIIIYFFSPPPCPESREGVWVEKGRVGEVSHKNMQTRLEIRLGRGELEKGRRNRNGRVGYIREGEAGEWLSLGQRGYCLPPGPLLLS